MATSGTIATTVIKTSRLIEKALRRCGINPASATVETLDTAREDLFMLMMSLSNRGLNLWCVDQQTVQLVAGQATYPLPAGTLDVLNVLLQTPQDGGGWRDFPLSAYNRDEYASLPNKSQASTRPTCYWFEKLRVPQLTLWPVPSDDTRRLLVFRHRQIQDVGALTEELEIPSRWLEAVCWQLALRLAFELPEVKPDRVAAIQAMRQEMTIEVEGGETDSAPVYFAPTIGVYTR